MRRIALIIFLLASFSSLYSQSDSFIRGVDLSFTPQIEDLGGKYKTNGIAKDVLDIFKENGVNYVRLRLWHSPSDGYCGLQKTLDFANRIKAKGFKFLLDIHYSDSWADPGKQTKPAAWTNLSFEVLKDSVYNYTKNVITLLKNQNTLPDMVQIGNEIKGGMLWPDGKIYGVGNEGNQWIKFTDLLKKGIAGAKDAAAPNQIKIMIHIDKGGDNGGSVYFFDHLIAQNVEFDIIGLSFYSWWDGALSSLEYNVNNLANRYNKEINVVETAYPWTLSWNDNTNNSVGLQSQLLTGYPATTQGQYDFVKSLMNIIQNIPNSKGNGFFYWAPDWISINNLGSSWENMTFFDFNSEMLNSISVFNYGSVTNENNISDSFRLDQNYPNPFNSSTIISYQLPFAGHITLKIFDLLGREIVTLIDEFKNAGTYNSQFSIINLPAGRQGSQLSSGVYFYTLKAGDFFQSRKMILLK